MEPSGTNNANGWEWDKHQVGQIRSGTNIKWNKPQVRQIKIENNKLKVGQTSSWTFIEKDKHQVGQIPSGTNTKWDKHQVGQTQRS